MDWLDALDFDQALRNVHSDVLGDWYRDPWGWPELDWLVPRHLDEFVLPRLNGAGVRQVAKLDVAKENFAVRPAVVLDPLDRLVYQALVDCLSLKMLRDLPPWAYGWRLPAVKPKRGVYSPNDEEWDAFRDHLKRLAGYDTAALTTDVVSFFGSIPEEPLTDLIRDRGNNEPAQRLAEMVSAFYRTTGRGLPQRSAASAALAHMYLGPIDDLLDQRNTVPPGGVKHIPEGRALRWMDDIWLFGRSAASLREAQVALQAAMRNLGLEMNVGKTRLLVGEEMNNTVFEFEHSAVDRALAEDDPDLTPLDELISRVLAAPATTDRTTIHFMTTRMRASNSFDRIEEVAHAAPQMPHAPDHLARLFRDSGHWIEMQGAYIALWNAWRTRLPWTVGQLGTMFPSNEVVDATLHDLFSEVLATTNAPLPLLTLAAQRLAVWDRSGARVLIQEAASREGSPLARRSLALAALHAGEVRTTLRRNLREHDENALTLAMLEDVDFDKRAVPVTGDFAGNV